jgi:hypothetical protein
LLYSFYSSCLFGVEAFDAGGKISIRELFRSKIFKVFTLQYVQAAIAVPSAYFVLTRLPVAGSVLAAVYVIVIIIAANLSTFIVLYWLMRRSICIPVAWVSMAKYVLAALLMAVILLVLPTTSTLLFTIAKAIAGFGIYVVLLLAIDKQARQLVRLILEEIKGSVRQLTSKENNNKNIISGENSTGTTEN